MTNLHEEMAQRGITNKHSLPPVVLAYLMADDYDWTPGENQYSATELVMPTAVAALLRKHRQEIERDAIDNIWGAIGRSVHRDVLRCSEKTGISETILQEERFTTTLEVDGEEATVSGKPDTWYPIAQHHSLGLTPEAEAEIEAAGGHADDYGIVGDFKTVSVWKLKFRDFEDWTRQVAIYAWILHREMGLTTFAGEIYAIAKDWSGTEAARDPEYPQMPFERIHLTLPALADTDSWIKSRIRALRAAMAAPDEAIEPCTPRERWEKPEKWAVMKDGRKTALRLLDTEADARQWAHRNGGRRPRCRAGAAPSFGRPS